MSGVERRPHLRRPCPLQQQDGCDWWQVTSWYVGGPDTTQAVNDMFLRAEAEAHLFNRHYRVSPTIFT